MCVRYVLPSHAWESPTLKRSLCIARSGTSTIVALDCLPPALIDGHRLRSADGFAQPDGPNRVSDPTRTRQLS